ncbi:UPF0147 family protein [Candidatus Woesearchaeota archaeon]|nr:UPF0147 family protein [Candidatus Woesearchaeota archaeon]
MVGKKQVDQVIEFLSDLKEESGVPKNVKSKIQEIINSLHDRSDISIKINKALTNLEEIADDANMQSYTRTQIWNVISLLEKLAC